MVETDVGETAGRRADVEDDFAAKILPAEVGERVREFDTAAADPRVIAALDGERHVLGEELPGFGDARVRGEDVARHDQRLRARAAFGEAARVQELIGADTGHGRWWHARAAGSIWSTMVPFSDLQLERYARHIVLPEIGGAGQRRLLAARVVVVGAGGIGAGLLPWLAAAGVGRVRLIDDDVVSLSNLQRQTLFERADIGALKVERAARALARINPDCAVEPVAVRLTAATAVELLAGADVVVDGSDNFATRLVVADWCHAAHVPLVSAAVGPFDGQLSVFRGWEADQPCYRCLVGSDPRAEERSCADAGVLGALVGVMGALAAVEVLRAVAEFGERLAGRLLLVDAMAMRQRTVGLAKDAGCAGCSTP